MTIAFGSAGTCVDHAFSSNIALVPYPTGIGAGDKLVLRFLTYEAVSASITGLDVAGWTLLASGITYSAVGGVYTFTEYVYEKTATGSESGDISITITSTTGSPHVEGYCARYTTSGSYGWAPTKVSGAAQATQNSTAISVTGTPSLAVAPGDMLLVGLTSVVDLTGADPTLSSESLTISGATLGSLTNRVGATGNNQFLYDSAVSSGTVTAAPAFTATASSAADGAAYVVRLRESQAFEVGILGRAGVAPERLPPRFFQSRHQQALAEPRVERAVVASGAAAPDRLPPRLFQARHQQAFGEPRIVTLPPVLAILGSRAKAFWLNGYVGSTWTDMVAGYTLAPQASNPPGSVTLPDGVNTARLYDGVNDDLSNGAMTGWSVASGGFRLSFCVFKASSDYTNASVNEGQMLFRFVGGTTGVQALAISNGISSSIGTLIFRSSDGTTTAYTTTTTRVDNSAYHRVIVQEDVAGQNVKVWLDGSLVADDSAAHVATPAWLDTSTAANMFGVGGARDGTSLQFLNGALGALGFAQSASTFAGGDVASIDAALAAYVIDLAADKWARVDAPAVARSSVFPTRSQSFVAEPRLPDYDVDRRKFAAVAVAPARLPPRLFRAPDQLAFAEPRLAPLERDRGFDRGALNLTFWVKGSYAGSPWVGSESLGASGGRNLTASTGDPPAVGAAVNGLTPADFDGVNDNMVLVGAPAMSTVVKTTASSGFAVVKVDSVSTTTATTSAQVWIFGTNGTGQYSLSLRDTGGGTYTASLRIFDSLGDQVVSCSISLNTWTALQWKHQVSPSKVMKIRAATLASTGAWQSLTPSGDGTVNSLAATLRVGQSAGGGPVYFDGQLEELALLQQYNTDALDDQILEQLLLVISGDSIGRAIAPERIDVRRFPSHLQLAFAEPRIDRRLVAFDAVEPEATRSLRFQAHQQQAAARSVLLERGLAFSDAEAPDLTRTAPRLRVAQQLAHAEPRVAERVLAFSDAEAPDHLPPRLVRSVDQLAFAEPRLIQLPRPAAEADSPSTAARLPGALVHQQLASPVVPVMPDRATVAFGAEMPARTLFVRRVQPEASASPSKLLQAAIANASQQVPDFAGVATAAAIASAVVSSSVPSFAGSATASAPALANASSTVPDFSGTAAARVLVTAAASSSVSDFTGASSGSVAVASSASQQVPPFASAAGAAVLVVADASQQVPPFTSGSTSGAPAQASAVQQVPPFESSSSAIALPIGSASSTVPDFSGIAAARVLVTASASKAIPNFTGASLAVVPVFAAGVVAIPNFTGASTAFALVKAVASSTIPDFVGAARGSAIAAANAAGSIPNFIAYSRGRAVATAHGYAVVPDFTAVAVVDERRRVVVEVHGAAASTRVVYTTTVGGRVYAVDLVVGGTVHVFGGSAR